MFHLIKKDFFIHKNILLIVLAALIIYMVLGVPNIFLGIVFAFVPTLHIFSSDEKHSVQILLSSLPVTRKEIVGSKYIVALLYIVILISLLIVGSYVIQQQQPNWIHLGLVASISLGFVSVIYPFSYKFTSKYLSFAGMFGLGLYLLTLKFLVPNLHDQIRAFVAKVTVFMEPQSMFFTFLISVVLYGISLFLSVKIYERKAL